MLEIRHLAATGADDAQAATPLLVPAPTYLKGKLIFTMLVAALLMNAVMVLVVLPRAADPLNYSLQLGDLYDLIGTNLAQGNGYRVDTQMGETMLREPGHPLLIAAVFKMWGYGVQGPRLACIVLAFGAALILLRLAREITGDSTIGVIAALLFLLYPATLVAEARAGVEMPCVLTVLLFMLALYRAVDKGGMLWYGVAGVLLGVASLVRSEVFLFPAFLLPYFLFTSRGWGQRGHAVLRMLVLGVATLVTIAPWIIRNYLLVHTFVPTATLAGVAAQEGLYTCEHLSQGEQFWLVQRGAGLERAEIARQLGLRFEGSFYYQFFYTPQDEVKFNRALLNDVSAEYRSNPGVLAGCAAKNLFFKFWFLGKTPQATRMNMLTQLPLLALALGGLVVLCKRGLLRKTAIILLYIIYVPMVHMAIIAHARHSVFVVPFLAVLAAVFLAWVWHPLRTQHSPTSGLQVRV
jgi:4-amino-4-deoxy-L-arabinose transferase-like glycosyltransferase